MVDKVTSLHGGYVPYMQAVYNLCAICVQPTGQARHEMVKTYKWQPEALCTCACILGSMVPPETSFTMCAPAATACAATSASKVSMEMGVDCSSCVSLIALHAPSIMSALMSASGGGQCYAFCVYSTACLVQWVCRWTGCSARHSAALSAVRINETRRHGPECRPDPLPMQFTD